MTPTPYTYLLYHIPTGLKYYGVQHGKKAHPNNLWRTYFSSSKKVKSLISQFGKESFKFEIRKTFSSGPDAFDWEQKVIAKMRLHERVEWLNQSLFNGPFHHAGAMTEQHKMKISNSLKGRKRSKSHCEAISRAKKGCVTWNRGLSTPIETRKNISNSRRGHPTRTGATLSQESKERIRNSLRGRKLTEDSTVSS